MNNDMSPDDQMPARALLEFYLEAGIDTIVGEEPVNRFGETPIAPAAKPKPAAEMPRPKPATRTFMQSATASPPPPNDAAMAAREAAKSATSLDELRSILEGFDGCGLKATATRLVFADGAPQSRLMFVGEAPGADEDRLGLPFVGRSGKLLDRMLAAIGLDRGQVYIANIVPWRPPGNRDPSPHETAICLPFIKRQIELCDPDILVCLGKPSMQTLLAITDPISKARGRWFSFDTGKRDIRAMPTFHPAFLL